MVATGFELGCSAGGKAMSVMAVRVGVVAASPLAGWGLMAILEQMVAVEPVLLSLEDMLMAKDGDGLSAVLVAPALAPPMQGAGDPEYAEKTASPDSVEELCSLVARLRRRRPGLKVIVVGGPLEPQEVQRVIGAGAKGYLRDSAGEGEVRMAIEVVLDGSIWAPRKVLAKLVDEGAAMASGEGAVDELSSRELEVLDLLMNGRSNREIASALGIEPATVKAHLGRMLRKTRSRNRLEMTLRIMEERNARAAG